MGNKLFDNNSLSRLIAEQITEEIITGKLQPGDKLIETNYAEEFGTSRAPIREAFYLLTIDGLVERIPRKGSVVKGYSAQDKIDLLEIRMFLETLALDRITKVGASESILQTMEELQAKMENENPMEYTKLNQKFHMAIIEMSNSEIIRMMYARLGLPLTSLQRITFEGKANRKKSLQEHRQILDFIHRGEFEKAKSILIENHQNLLKPALDA
ncbi:GntR family transcriptional regulator [Mesobacillus maritimus]|uniref:GntR family transcriptional regulator n=1 Tax=Mesobacillus maritimus TaxID=1643336 RepID=UPI00203D2A6E|nr:GntR family transcriptional regulator [Mesobacillus maritimus]MCM3670744.1 GntR family transcriptional regulator [Mesobacillus maritimus]